MRRREKTRREKTATRQGRDANTRDRVVANGRMHDDVGERAERARSFGAIAEEYDRFRPGPPAEAVEWLVPPGCGLAVDIGVGTGALTRLLVGRAGRVVAVEPDERMADVLRASRAAKARRRSGPVKRRVGRAAAVPSPVWDRGRDRRGRRRSWGTGPR